MNNFWVIKNGLCLTLDSAGKSGYFNIILRGNKIFDIDYENDLKTDEEIYRKYPEVEIFDATDKLIVPAFLNSQKNSSYILADYFIDENTFDNINTNVSLKLIDKYFLSEVNQNDLLNLLSISYASSVLNGEFFINESSKYIVADIVRTNVLSTLPLKPEIILTVYDNYISDYCLGINKFHCIGLREEEDLNNYSLSSLKKALQRGNKRAIIEILQTANSSEQLKNLFGKSFIKVLSDNELLNNSVIISNPIYINNEEINLLSENKVNLIFCPTDANKLSKQDIDYRKYLNKEFNLVIGTGILGKSILSELRFLKNRLGNSSISNESLLRMVTVNPSVLFGISNICGTIEKNKIANLIMFDISDVRNMLNIPEMTAEYISRYIIENLDRKDISDVVIKGSFVLKNYISEKTDYIKIRESNKKLSSLIFSLGKYQELKEKYKMRERVDEISLGSNPNRRNEDLLNQKDYESENFWKGEIIPGSEFRIIGSHKPDYFNPDSDDDNINSEDAGWKEEYSDIVKEISDFNNGLSIFNVDELDSSINEAKIQNEDPLLIARREVKNPSKRLFFDDSGGESNIVEDNLTPINIKNIKDTPKKPKETVFKKDKLKFGFEEENS
jgi:cytosine/adenosine deaminase-related metal-dependent hydrolase